MANQRFIVKRERDNKTWGVWDTHVKAWASGPFTVPYRRLPTKSLAQDSATRMERQAI